MNEIVYLSHYLENEKPVPTLENMKTVYQNIFHREPVGLWKNTIEVCHENGVKCEEPKPEKDILKEKRFAKRARPHWDGGGGNDNEAVFEMLDNLTAYIVVEEGIFYARQNEGVRYWHKNGNIYKIGNKENILRFEYENGKLTVHAYLGLRQKYENKHIEWYNHLDDEMSEKWEDAYDILSESEMFQYQDILKTINGLER